MIFYICYTFPHFISERKQTDSERPLQLSDAISSSSVAAFAEHKRITGRNSALRRITGKNMIYLRCCEKETGIAISKRQRRKALSLTAYTAVKSSKTEKNFVREYRLVQPGMRAVLKE